MQSVTGQVRHTKLTEKFFEYVKKIEVEKAKQKEKKTLLNELIAAKSEVDSIKGNLKLVTDRDAQEYCIYRLKAAELNFNRYIKLAKALGLSCLPFKEEVL
ncbi:MAG: DUF2508 family protein [Clostridia bacterium]|nr:DUF2508 family protein [Clostridia bacterium]